MVTDSERLFAEQREERAERLHLGGSWENQLGSVLNLEDDGAGGLGGFYQSATGATTGASYPVRGFYNLSDSRPCRVIGFVVDWGVHHALTAWSGRYYPETDSIHATWLMTTSTTGEDEWRSTLVGQDLFRRSRPRSRDEVLERRKRWAKRMQQSLRRREALRVVNGPRPG